MLTDTNSFVRHTMELEGFMDDGNDFLAAAEADFYRGQIAEASPREVLVSPEKDSGSVSIKCVVVGDHGVGKTAMLARYVLNRFDEVTEPTVLDNYAGELKLFQEPSPFTKMRERERERRRKEKRNNRRQ